MHIFCDESGNTGSDLLTKDQPLFSIASTCLDKDTSESLIAHLRRQGQKEVKYSRLRSTVSGQALLIKFLSSPELVRATTKVVVADKQYYLVTHLVDKLIEPVMSERGDDLYARDRHVYLTNMWYFFGSRFFPNGQWKKILIAFNSAIRSFSKSAYENFDNVLVRAVREAPSEYGDIVGALILARGRLDEFIGCYSGGVVFDPAPDLLTSLTHKWMEEVSGRFRLTHDKSKPLLKNEKFFRALMTDVPTRMIGYGDRQAELPLRISEFDFADSRECPQLQVADIVAGATSDALCAFMGKKPRLRYHELLIETNLESVFVDGMLPSKDFKLAENPAAGQLNLVDGSTAFLNEIGYPFNIRIKEIDIEQSLQ